MANKTFEDFKVGEAFEGSYRRTMTEAELVTVVHLAGLRTPLFLDEEWCRTHVPDGRRRFPGFLGLGVANAMCEEYVGHGHAGVRRLDRVIFHGSVRPGDTVHARGSVVGKDSGSDPEKGTVTLNIRLYNQAEQLLLEFEPVFTMPRRRGFA
jgi:acyl dehydratase